MTNASIYRLFKRSGGKVSKLADNFYRIIAPGFGPLFVDHAGLLEAVEVLRERAKRSREERRLKV